MNYSCTKCSLEKGISISLSGAGKTGEFACSVNPKHGFRAGKSGFVESVPEL